MQTTERPPVAPVARPQHRRAVPPVLLSVVLTATTFLAATLLFSVQPMVAKLLLPRLGGSPSVWNTAMVFFQLTLLAGYLYAHVATTRLRPATHRLVQIGLVALFVVTLPIALPGDWEAPSTAVSWWMMAALLVMVGGPFFALSTISPTMQRWMSEADHPRADNPYFLYAASNAGSLLALLAYPLVLEPLWSVEIHVSAWAVGYGVLAALVAVSAWLARPLRAVARPDRSTVDSSPITWGQRGFWVYAAMVPSALMLGVTRHLATDVASFPLLWVVPLAVYLLTFVVAFRGDPDRKIAGSAEAVRFLVVPLLIVGSVAPRSAVAMILLPLVFFAVAALLAHTRLYAARPAASDLTDFYLWVSVGGALGGVGASLLAPVVFNSIAEYPIALGLALTLLPATRRFAPTRSSIVVGALLGIGVVAVAAAPFAGLAHVRVLFVSVTAVLAFAALRRTPVFALVMILLLAATTVDRHVSVFEERTFFGVYRVWVSDDAHVFSSGTTLHGLQANVAEGGGGPVGYYAPEGPIGRMLEASRAVPRHMALIGLGAGSLADYGTPADRIDFYEIDPVVVDVARDERFFTHLSRSEAPLDVIVGDGRLALAEAPAGAHDVIVVDAFSSDAIPTHLLTVEAVSLYAEKLDDRGVVALHISNRHLDLEPVVGRIASELGFDARIERFQPTEEESARLVLPSYWVLLARDAETLGRWLPAGDWRRLRTDGPLWTDAHTSILEIFELG